MVDGTDLLENKKIEDEFKFRSFKNCEEIKYKDEQITSHLIESILHNFVSDQIGFNISMTNGGRIYYIALKLTMTSNYSLWMITPCHKNEVAREVTPIFLLSKAVEDGRVWLALESNLGKLWSFGSIKPYELKEMVENIL